MIHNEVEFKNKENDTYLTILNKLIMRTGHRLRIKYCDLDKDDYNSDDDSSEDKPTRKAQLIENILSVNDNNFDIDNLLKKQSKSELNSTEKWALKRFFYKNTLKLDKNISNNELKKFLEIYIDNEHLYHSYRYLFGYDPIPGRDIDHLSHAKEKAKLKIIVNFYNLLTGSKIKGLVLPEFDPINFSKKQYDEGMTRIVSKSIYFRNPHKYHSLFFQSKIRNRRKYNSKKNTKNVVDQCHTQTVQHIFDKVGIKICRIRKKIKGKRITSFLLQLHENIRNINYIEV